MKKMNKFRFFYFVTLFSALSILPFVIIRRIRYSDQLSCLSQIHSDVVGVGCSPSTSNGLIEIFNSTTYSSKGILFDSCSKSINGVIIDYWGNPIRFLLDNRKSDKRCYVGVWSIGADAIPRTSDDLFYPLRWRYVDIRQKAIKR